MGGHQTTVASLILLISCWRNVIGFAPSSFGILSKSKTKGCGFSPVHPRTVCILSKSKTKGCGFSPVHPRTVCHVLHKRRPDTTKPWPLSADVVKGEAIVETASSFQFPVWTGMSDLAKQLEDETASVSVQQLKPAGDGGVNKQVLLAGAGALLIGACYGVMMSLHITPADALAFVERLIASPQDTLQDVIAYVNDMGPAGVIYFGIVYLIAEILAVPATPLTLSAGYLFGMTTGVAVVLCAASIAASVAFLIGKTFLRTWVEGILDDNPKLKRIDEAIGREGFKLLFLVRISPLFPFALSNYVYGASSIDFVPYFWGTLLGFAPGTCAYVYTGMVGQALTLGGEGTQPWYVYAGGFAVLLGVLKLVSDVASEVVGAASEVEG